MSNIISRLRPLTRKVMTLAVLSPPAGVQIAYQPVPMHFPG